jgi:hypothetical protein
LGKRIPIKAAAVGDDVTITLRASAADGTPFNWSAVTVEHPIVFDGVTSSEVWTLTDPVVDTPSGTSTRVMRLSDAATAALGAGRVQSYLRVKNGSGPTDDSRVWITIDFELKPAVASSRSVGPVAAVADIDVVSGLEVAIDLVSQIATPTTAFTRGFLAGSTSQADAQAALGLGTAATHATGYFDLAGDATAAAAGEATARATAIAGVTTALSAKADLVSGKIPTGQLPSVALTNAVTAADQAAMLALTSTQVQPGDVAIRSDGAGTFLLVATPASTLANWVLLATPTGAVSSVNGQSGTVVLAKADVSLGNVDNTADTGKPVSSAQATAIAAAQTAAVSAAAVAVLPKLLPFQPTTAYTAGTYVTNGGVLYAANADFTSGASFLASDWTPKSAASSSTVFGLIKTAGSSLAITGTDTTTAVTPKAATDAINNIVDPVKTRVTALEAGGTSSVAQTDVPVAATTTDAILCSTVAFAANELAIGDTIVGYIDMSVVNGSGAAADAVFKLKLGANVLLVNAASLTYAATANIVSQHLTIRIRIKSSNTILVAMQMVGGNAVSAQTTAGLLSAAKGFVGLNPADVGHFAIASTNQFDLAVAWSAASASNIVTVNDVYFGVVKGS